MSGPHDLGRRRDVVLHLHIYKNAGSTVDRLLEQHFGDAWMTIDGPLHDFFLHQSELDFLVRRRRHLLAVSSHHARLPIPQSEAVRYRPLVLLRLPDLRYASVWRFERARTDPFLHASAAQRLGFKEWVEEQLRTRRLSNQQAYLLSFGHDERVPQHHPGQFDRAAGNLAALEVVGLVERFDASLDAFERAYGPIFGPRAAAAPRVNATAVPASIGEQRAWVSDLLGEVLYEDLLAANLDDLHLYEAAERRLQERAGGPRSEVT